jgi:hypothetical protein
MDETRLAQRPGADDNHLAPILTATLRELVNAKRERNLFRDLSVLLMGETHRQAATIRRQTALIREHVSGRLTGRERSAA